MSASWSPGDVLAHAHSGRAAPGAIARRRWAGRRRSGPGDRGSIRWHLRDGGVVGRIPRVRRRAPSVGQASRRHTRRRAAIVPSIGVAFGEPAFGKLVAIAPRRLPRHDVTSYATCQGRNADAFSSLQSLPDGSGAVYAGDCAPPSDVFTVRPNGSGLARVTQTSADETSVTASPDGTRLAFTRTVEAECVGCDERLEATNAAGGGRGHDPAGCADRRHPAGPAIRASRPTAPRSSSAAGTRRSATRPASTASPPPAGTRRRSGSSAPPRHGGRLEIAYQRPDRESRRSRRTAPATGGWQASRSADEGPVAWSTNGRLAVLRTARRPLAILIPSTGRRIPLPGFSDADRARRRPRVVARTGRSCRSSRPTTRASRTSGGFERRRDTTWRA